MCNNPRYIDNPNYRSPVKDPVYHRLHDTIHKKIPVPCGHCSVCVHLRQCYVTQRVQMESLNRDLYYLTLTYNQDSLPRSRYGDILFAHCDLRDWQCMIKMIKKHEDLPRFRYMLVNEYGGKRHRPHYHAILSFPRSGSRSEALSLEQKLWKIFLKYWRRNNGSTRSPDWQPLLTYQYRRGKRNYDLHYLDPLSSDKGLDGVSFYTSKYSMKADRWQDKFKSFLFFNLSDSQYSEAIKKFRTRVYWSHGFGSPYDPGVMNHIRKGVDFSLKSGMMYPCYISRYDGSTYPLAPYYRIRSLTIDDQLIFRSRQPEYDDEPDLHRITESELRHARNVNYLASRVSLWDLDMDDMNLDVIDPSYLDKKNRYDVSAGLSVDESFLTALSDLPF